MARDFDFKLAEIVYRALDTDPEGSAVFLREYAPKTVAAIEENARSTNASHAVHRSAETGRYVTEDQAESDPATTVEEQQ